MGWPRYDEISPLFFQYQFPVIIKHLRGHVKLLCHKPRVPAIHALCKRVFVGVYQQSCRLCPRPPFMLHFRGHIAVGVTVPPVDQLVYERASLGRVCESPVDDDGLVLIAVYSP